MADKPRVFISYRRVDSAALATLIALTLQDKHGIDSERNIVGATRRVAPT